jgi:hypothetical protein
MMNVILLYSLPFVSALLAVLEAYFDAKNSKVRIIEHLVSASLRVCIAVISTIYAFGYKNFFLIWKIEIVYVVFLLSIFWLIFDPAYNVWKNGWKDIWRIGKTAWVDRTVRVVFGQKLKDNYGNITLIELEDGRVYTALKGVLCFICLMILIYFGY